ncbi:hypothetical protein MAJHIDBO_01785 [Propionibacterium freudenreichii subsp. shermanii]|nr:hypothetical protein MAJHIDBO_01785 [Propionibacterium freudenreichii subsp. shermanii]SPS09574.1 hypothetical protein MAJHIDBO_01785 [Propionibacterium freudenreichii subsp. shermanii]
MNAPGRVTRPTVRVLSRAGTMASPVIGSSTIPMAFERGSPIDRTAS